MTKATNFGEKNPLQCDNCDEYMYFAIKGVRVKNDKKTKGIGMNLPFYECKNCGFSRPIKSKEKTIQFANKMLEKVEDGEFIPLNIKYLFGSETELEKGKFPQFDSLSFQYDSMDYYFIPGLYREWDKGFLTPIFFDIDVLIYYNNHSDYRVELTSLSRVHIYDKDGNAIIPHGFGINRNGKLICWLGDLQEQFTKPENERHLKQFRTFNIESDHDIVSDYYFNQIEAEFTESDNEVGIFSNKNDFENELEKKFGYRISKVDIDELTKEYKHPIINEKDQVFNAYLKLNNILNESIQNDVLRTALKSKGMTNDELKGLRSLKLFELFLEKVLAIENVSVVICPLYVLYDLRLLAGHIEDSNFQEKYDNCKNRLNSPTEISHLDFFKNVVTSLIAFYNALLETTKK